MIGLFFEIKGIRLTKNKVFINIKKPSLFDKGVPRTGEGPISPKVFRQIFSANSAILAHSAIWGQNFFSSKNENA